jgi:1,2-phenylacetyl-CoA epoxidase catalytic subunit
MSDNFEIDSMTNMIVSVERAAKLRERLAILQIVIEELKHGQSQLAIDALDRVAASIEHRTQKGL